MSSGSALRGSDLDWLTLGKGLNLCVSVASMMLAILFIIQDYCDEYMNSPM